MSAPRTTQAGALSPPIASSASLIMLLSELTSWRLPVRDLFLGDRTYFSGDFKLERPAKGWVFPSSPARKLSGAPSLRGHAVADNASIWATISPRSMQPLTKGSASPRPTTISSSGTDARTYRSSISKSTDSETGSPVTIQACVMSACSFPRTSQAPFAARLIRRSAPSASTERYPKRSASYARSVSLVSSLPISAPVGGRVCTSIMASSEKLCITGPSKIPGSAIGLR